MNIYELIIPSYYAPVIENDDMSHLTNEEVEEVTSFMENMKSEHGPGTWEHVRNIGFQYRNDVNSLGGQCDMYKYHVK